MNIKKISLLLFSAACVFHGNPTLAMNKEAAKLQESGNQSQIALGARLENPYSVDNMQRAFSRYNQKVPNSPYDNRPTIQATHQYIRINPTNQFHLNLLKNLDGANNGDIVLQDHPLDREINSDGDYYVMPHDETDLFYPVYTVIPVGFNMPTGLPYEVLEKLYRPTDEEYDVESMALEAAGWENEDSCKGSVIICEDDGITPSNTDEGATLQNNTAASQRIFSRRYRPHGYVMIENTEVAQTNSSNKMEPLRQAKISIGRGFWWQYTHTDNNGHFESPKKYRGKVRIRAKWRSNIATIRKSWNEMLGIQVSDHLMTITRSSNGRTKNINFGDDRLWYKGTVHNGLVKYNDYAAANGISKLVSGANVWVWKNGQSVGATPMFNHHRHLSKISSIAGIGQSNVWDVLVNSAASYVINLVPQRLQPDMIFSGLQGFNRTRGVVNTREIEQLVFHEAAHYSHSKQAGSWYWAKLVASELANMLTTAPDFAPYGDGSEPSFTAAKQIALAEGWATLVEFRAMLDRYGVARDWNTWESSWQISRLMDGYDAYTVPLSVAQNAEFQGWFLQGLFWDVIDNQADFSADFRDGTTGNRVTNVFNGRISDNTFISHSQELRPVFSLLQNDVYTACDFGKDLVNANPVDGPDIETLFHSYGFTCVDGGDGLSVPATPSGFYISHSGGTTNTLYWNAVSQADYYQVYKSSGTSSTGNYYFNSTVNAPNRSRIVHVTSNQYYKVRACNAAGCSSFTSPKLARYSGGPGDDCIRPADAGDVRELNDDLHSSVQIVPICPMP